MAFLFYCLKICYLQICSQLLVEPPVAYSGVVKMKVRSTQ